MSETYGEMVARLRDDQGWSQEAFAEHVGIGRRTLQAIESGETRNPHRDTRLRINQTLGITGEAGTSGAQPWPDLDDETREKLMLFADYDNEVLGILLIVAAHLQLKTANQRLTWLRDLSGEW